VTIQLKYGPSGNPLSRDPFEYAQAHAPDGWHVEGQMFGLPFVGWRMEATGPTTAGGERRWRSVVGYTRLLAAANLVRAMSEG
jgi:hypothetical protein